MSSFFSNTQKEPMQAFALNKELKSKPRLRQKRQKKKELQLKQQRQKRMLSQV